MLSLGCFTVWLLLRTDVSEECNASIIRVNRIGKLGTLAVTSNHHMLRRNTTFYHYTLSSSCPIACFCVVIPVGFPLLTKSFIAISPLPHVSAFCFSCCNWLIVQCSSLLITLYFYQTNVFVGRSNSQLNQHLSLNQTDLSAKSARKNLMIHTSSRTLIMQCVTAAGTDFQSSLMGSYQQYSGTLQGIILWFSGQNRMKWST
jgi:hypothetical protein